MNWLSDTGWNHEGSTDVRSPYPRIKRNLSLALTPWTIARQSSQRRLAGRWVSLPAESGFSLLELIIVLAILGLGFAFVAPNFARSFDSVRYQAAIREVASGLRQVRGIALSQGREAVFFLDVDKHRYRIDHQSKFHSMPNWMDLTLETAASELTGPGQGYIRFFPDGSATGGRIVMEWNKRRVRVDINWLTGRVTMGEMNDENG